MRNTVQLADGGGRNCRLILLRENRSRPREHTESLHLSGDGLSPDECSELFTAQAPCLLLGPVQDVPWGVGHPLPCLAMTMPCPLMCSGQTPGNLSKALRTAQMDLFPFHCYFLCLNTLPEGRYRGHSRSDLRSSMLRRKAQRPSSLKSTLEVQQRWEVMVER